MRGAFSISGACEGEGTFKALIDPTIPSREVLVCGDRVLDEYDAGRPSHLGGYEYWGGSIGGHHEADEMTAIEGGVAPQEEDIGEITSDQDGASRGDMSVISPDIGTSNDMVLESRVDMTQEMPDATDQADQDVTTSIDRGVDQVGGVDMAVPGDVGSVSDMSENTDIGG